MWPCPARPPAVERIEGAARERGETIAGLRRAELLSLVEGEGAAEASPEELAFDVRTALAKDPARRGMDELAMRTLAERIAEHLAQARLRFTRARRPRRCARRARSAPRSCFAARSSR